MSTSLQLAEFPEELLEGILSHCLIASLFQAPRPSWHRAESTPTTDHPIRGRMAILLVCKKFLRISTPLYYHTVHVFSANQLHRLLSAALRPNPQLASYIRRIVFSGIWADGGEVLRMSGASLRTLDVTLDSTQLSPGVQGESRDLDAEEFCEGLKFLPSLTHIVVRKPNDVYITRPKPQYVLSEIANAMQGWTGLEYADIAFRISDDSGTTVINATKPAQQGPITALTEALSTRPNLHTFVTLVPSLWNEAILRVSTNPSLERIVLGDGSQTAGYGKYGLGSRPSVVQWSAKDLYAAPVSASLPIQASTPYFEATGHGIMGTGLFMLQAKKHARLSELIRSGTYISRTRALTLDTQGPGLMACSSAPRHWPQHSSPTYTSTSANAPGRISAPPSPLSSPTSTRANGRFSASAPAPSQCHCEGQNPASTSTANGPSSGYNCNSSASPTRSRAVCPGNSTFSAGPGLPKRRMTGA